ncbi:MAG: hypothetical protein AB7Q29_14090 [Vicinamibacterales bacterium]
MSGIDAEIDELYALPLAEFTAARNRLARTLKGDDAARVKRLPKPATVAWAVNGLYWHDRQTWQRLMQAGRALRQAQIAALEGRRSDVRKAADAHRHALAEAAQRAMAHAARGEVHPSIDQVSRMLEAVSLAGDVRPGRFTEVLQPAGFEALAGVTPVSRGLPDAAALSPVPRRASTGASLPGTHDNRAGVNDRDHAQAARAAAAEKAAARRAAQQSVDRAEREVESAAQERRRAEEQVAAARRRLDDTEAEAARLRDREAAARRELAQARALLARSG